MKKIFKFSIITLVFLSSLFIVDSALALIPGNANGDKGVDGLDYVIWLNNYGLSGKGFSSGNFNGDNAVDGLDYVTWLNNYGALEPTSTPPIGNSGEWSQFGSNAQKTNYTATVPATPWKYKWQWNGADASGKQQAGHLAVPDMIQPITGAGMVYMVGGNSVYALNKTSGAVVWSKGGIGNLTSTPAFYNGYLFVPSDNGTLYQLRADTGANVTSINIGGSLKAPLITSSTIIVGSSSGTVTALDATNLSKKWQYSSGSPIVSPVAFSPSKNIVIANAQDLNVHAINAQTGALIWKTKPTQRTYQSGNPSSSGAQFENGWPVIAEQHGVVFVRYRLDWDTLWAWNPYPTTNSAIRSGLVSQPNQQSLYALNISTGQTAFIPAVGNGGRGDGGDLPMGPQPVVSNIGGQEVVYIIWRNGLTCANAGWCDGREDAAMGEMVLDSNTVPGYQAGDVRFVRNPDIQTDEMMNVTMAGDTVFHSHWLINSAEKVTDRSNNLGSTFANPIKTTDSPFVIWRQCNQANVCSYPNCTGNTVCGINCAPSNSRYCSQGLYSYGDARSYPPGFYEYNNDINSGSMPFTIVSAGQVLVKTTDGAIIALENGSPTSNSENSSTIAKKDEVTNVLGAVFPSAVSYTEAINHVGEYASFTGVIKSAVNHLPKALYLGFSDPHDGNLLIRIFSKDVDKFKYNPLSLKGKRIEVRGLVTTYWPENKDPEIIVTDAGQITVLD